MTENPPSFAHLDLFNACAPRSASSANENYAADLHGALRNELGSIESARQFFQSTYPTNGLSEICRTIFSRLTLGNESNESSLYRIDSSFGGGKTHTLIALAGLAKHTELIREDITPVPSNLVPDEPVRIVAFTGENTDLVNGAYLGDDFPSIRPKSLIGHIAVQIGGDFAFRRFENHDINLTSPGSEEIAQLIGDAPCIILIDELVQLLRRYEDADFRDKLPQLTTLCSALAKAVENSPRAVMVITTPDPAGDAYQDASAQVNHILGEIDSVLARTMFQAVSSQPDGSDLPRILRKRLFADVDESVRQEVSELYANLLQRSAAMISPPPQDRTVRQWFSDNYPFHPDTLAIITERLSANDNFQKTRGTLRLLAKTIQNMRRPANDDGAMLIHPHHITPDSPDISGEIITRLSKSDFQSAISADITGPDSTAVRIDEARQSNPAGRIARAALLSSLSPIATAQGLSSPELIRAVVMPTDDDPAVISNAIAEFRSKALYVNDNPTDPTVRFTTVPSLNRILLERGRAISARDVRSHLTSAITKCFSMPNRNSQDHMEASIFPFEANIPDSPDRVHLGIINYEWLTEGQAGLPAALTTFYRNSPQNNGQAPRQFKNNMVILVADNPDDNQMEMFARRYLAARQVNDNPPETLQDYQKVNLASELASSERDLYIAIQKLYVNLYYPSVDDAISNDALLTRIRITQDDASEVPSQGQHAVIKTLRGRSKLLMRDSANLDGEMYWNTRPNLRNSKALLSGIKEEFGREPRNYMLLNKAVSDQLFRNALDMGFLVIQTGAGQIITASNSLVHTDDPDAMVYLRTNACDDCHRYKDDCQCNAPQLRRVQLCIDCGKPLHPGACEQDAPTAPTGSPFIPDFSSGLDAKPLNVLAGDLRLYMADNDMTTVDIDVLILSGYKAEFINFIASMLGQNASASVSYRLQRDTDLSIAFNGMDITDWNRVFAPLAPRIEVVEDVELLDASVAISSGSTTPEQFEQILNQMPASREASMNVSFKQPVESL